METRAHRPKESKNAAALFELERGRRESHRNFVGVETKGKLEKNVIPPPPTRSCDFCTSSSAPTSKTKRKNTRAPADTTAVCRSLFGGLRRCFLLHAMHVCGCLSSHRAPGPLGLEGLLGFLPACCAGVGLYVVGSRQCSCFAADRFCAAHFAPTFKAGGSPSVLLSRVAVPPQVITRSTDYL